MQISFFCFLHRHLNLFCIFLTNRQFIIAESYLDWISHRSYFFYNNFCLWDQTHIQKMLPQRACTAHSIHYGAFADL